MSGFLRRLRRDRVYTLVVVATLALGIGGTTLVFSIVEALILSPLPYGRPAGLVVIQPGPRWETYREIEARNRAFTEVAAYTERTVNVTGVNPPERVPVGLVSRRFLSVTDTHPALGRAFADQEFADGGVVLLTDRFWRRHFAASASVIGRSLQLDDRTYVIVGVLPPTFKSPPEIPAGRGMSIEWGASVLIPMVGDPRVRDLASSDPSWRGLSVVARLRPNVGIHEAEAEVRRIARSTAPGDYGNQQYLVLSLADYARGDVTLQLALVGAAVGLLLLIACVNVLNLTLAAWANRAAETATRLALGASRLDIIKDTVRQTTLLALIGAVCGCWLAWGGTEAMRLWVGGLLSGIDRLSVNAHVLIFAIALALAVGVVVGLIPGIVASRMELTMSMRNARGEAGATASVRSVLVVAEVATAVIGIACSGLLARDFLQLSRTDLGFNPAGVLTANIALSPVRFPTSVSRLSFFRAVMGRVAALPGVDSVALSRRAPAEPTTVFVRVQVLRDSNERAETASPETCDIVAGNYFRTIAMPVLAGRGIDPRDNATSERVAVINEAFQRKYWGNGSGLGRAVAFGGVPYTIVGVVRDLRTITTRGQPNGETLVYFPYEQLPGPSANMTLLVHAKGDVHSLALGVARAVQDLSSTQPVHNIMALERIVAAPVLRRRAVMVMTLVFGVVALLLSMVGVYGAVAYSVAQRRQAIGIRLMLGGPPRTVFAGTVIAGMRLVLCGAACGLPAALWAASVMRSQLVLLRPADPGALIGSVLFVITCGVVGCAVPAWAAMRVDPMVCVRNE